MRSAWSWSLIATKGKCSIVPHYFIGSWHCQQPQSFCQGGAFPQQRNRWLSSLRNIEQENNFEGETVYWTDVWLSLQNPEINWKPLSLGYVQGNDNFVSLTPLCLAYLYKVQCCTPPSHFSHDLVDMFSRD